MFVFLQRADQVFVQAWQMEDIKNYGINRQLCITAVADSARLSKDEENKKTMRVGVWNRWNNHPEGDRFFLTPLNSATP